ncbi:DUF4221 domain-containing protein [Halosquirtibacter xylanolyticus]|uniref:DUF4221 family protein n=1 Tax=Halosquirtibacter xylanolyticus TaxID=3374599 RepID=UPI003747E345|nr:DUF4221 domain-containing protein [Prolixibacteraceae bacterium]
MLSKIKNIRPMEYNWLILVVSFILFSCVENNEDKFIIKRGELISVPVSNQFDVDQGRFTYYHGDKKGEEYLIYYNKNNNVVSEVSLSEKKERKLFKLAKSGKDNVGDANIIQKLGKDSFLVNSPLTYNLSWVDGEGHPVKNVVLLKGSMSDETCTVWFNEHTNFTNVDNLIYMAAAPDKNPDSSSFFMNSNTLFSLDIKSDSFQYFMPFPKDIQGYLWGLTCARPSVCLSLDDKSLLVSYGMKESLVSYDLSSKEVGDVNIKNGSAYKVEKCDPSLVNKGLSFYDMTTPYLYTGLLRDPFRHVYYRVVEHGLDKELVKKTKYKYWTYKTISILVYNENFEQIAEKKLEDRKYVSHKFFVGERGFYVQQFHPDDPNVSEDELKFQCFELMKRS